MTRSAELRECLDLLGGRRWRFLILNASDNAPGSLDVLSRAHQSCPDVPVLVLVRRGDVQTAVRAMKTGAADCVETSVECDRLLAAVAGLCGREDRSSHDLWLHLTRGERIVLWHILAGRTNRQIGEALCRSARTVEVHRHHIMKKLGATTLVELVKRALRVGGRSGSHLELGLVQQNPQFRGMARR